MEEIKKVLCSLDFSREERDDEIKKLVGKETKAEKVSDMEIKSLWGNTNFDAIVSQSLANQTRMLIVSVYAPQSVSLKRTLWSYLSSLINRWNGECIVLGDFNEVRRKEERWGSIFNVYGARDFNHFITSAGLVEVQLEGYSYTWAHPSASKMSKLDRFLVSDGFLSLFPHTSAVCLDRHLSDHRPILLREFNTDYGATPFRLFHSWFDFQGFDDMITQTWNSINLNDSNAMVRFKKKLQALKKVIRLWIGNYKRNQMNRTTEKSFGFGVKWCSWIRGILNSSMASILVNGSPTKDFYGEWSRCNLTVLCTLFVVFSLYRSLINLKKSNSLVLGIPGNLREKRLLGLAGLRFLVPKSNGGLGVSVFLLKKRLLFKWRFGAFVSGSSLWASFNQVQTSALEGGVLHFMVVLSGHIETSYLFSDSNLRNDGILKDELGVFFFEFGKGVNSISSLQKSYQFS
ncbi:RNA-directed DNA polymerase, eukaryota [Tanacetum coccineum]